MPHPSTRRSSPASTTPGEDKKSARTPSSRASSTKSSDATKSGLILPRVNPAAIAAAEGPLLARGTTKATHLAVGHAPENGTVVTSQSKKRKRNNEDDDEGDDAPLFSSLGKPDAKKKKTAAAKKKAKAAAAPEEREEDEFGRFCPPLTVKTLAVGCKLMGIVKAYNETSLVLALPNNLKCDVKFAEVSDEHRAAVDGGRVFTSEEMQASLPVFSFVRAVVTEIVTDVKNRSRMEVSLRTSLVNKGAVPPTSVGDAAFASVKSVEDHGFILNFGFRGIENGFLPKDKKTTKHLGLGSPVHVVVVSRNERGVATCRVLTSEDRLSPDATFAHVQPGLLVQARATRELLDGARVLSFHEHFKGTVDAFHVPRDSSLDLSAELLARVLWVDASAKRVGLTLLPHLIEMTVPEVLRTRRLLDVVDEKARVLRVHPYNGLTMSFQDAQAAFAPSSKLVDSLPSTASTGAKKNLALGLDATTMSGLFKQGETRAARVVGESLLEGSVLVSLQPSVLKSVVMRFEDVKPGDVLKGTIVKVDPAFGVLVQLGHDVRGLVPLAQLADAKVSDVEARFKVDQVVKARVLMVDPAKKRVELTLKKSMLTSDVVSSYDPKLVNGVVSFGFVTKTGPFGLVVTFVNNVHGIVQAHDLGTAAHAPSDYYEFGQTVKVRVLSADPVKSRMRLTLNTSATTASSESPVALSSSIAPCTVVDGVVKSKTPEGMTVETKDASHAYWIPASHLTDFEDSKSAHLARVTVGQKLKGVLVLRTGGGGATTSEEEGSTSERKPRGVASLKPLLLKHAARLPSSFEELEMDAVLPAYVTGVTAAGVFVRYGGELSALAPRANVSGAYVVGQTVVTRVTSLDPETRRALVSLKPSATTTDPEWTAEYVRSLLHNQRKTTSSTVKTGQLLRDAVVVSTKTSEGSKVFVVEAKASSTTEEGSKLVGELSASHAPSSTKQGSRFETVRVLDVDARTAVVAVSAKPELVRSTTKWKALASSAGTEETTTGAWRATRAVVEWACSTHAVVSVTSGATTTLWSCGVRSFNEPESDASPASLTLGSTIDVLTPEHGEVCVLATEEAAAARTARRPRARSGSLMDFHLPSGVEVGSFVDALVTDIRSSWMACQVKTTTGEEDAKKKKKRKLDEVAGGEEVKTLEAKVHAIDAADPVAGDAPTLENVFARHSVGDVVKARVVGKERGTDCLLLTLRPSEVEAGPTAPLADRATSSKLLRPGQEIWGAVVKTSSEGLTVALSNSMKCFCYCVDVSEDLEELNELFNLGKAAVEFPVGRPVKIRVTGAEPGSLDKRVRAVLIERG